MKRDRSHNRSHKKKRLKKLLSTHNYSFYFCERMLSIREGEVFKVLLYIKHRFFNIIIVLTPFLKWLRCWLFSGNSNIGLEVSKVKKTINVKNDEQILKTVRECMRGMNRQGEITESTETSWPKSSGDPLADLRELLARAAIWQGGMPPRGAK